MAEEASVPPPPAAPKGGKGGGRGKGSDTAGKILGFLNLGMLAFALLGWAAWIIMLAGALLSASSCCCCCCCLLHSSMERV